MNKKKNKVSKVVVLGTILILLISSHMVFKKSLSTSTNDIKDLLWNVEVTSVIIDPSSTGKELKSPILSENSQMVRLSINLEEENDKIIYNINLKNSGSIDAILKSVPSVYGINGENVNYNLTYKDGSEIRIPKSKEEIASMTLHTNESISYKLVITNNQNIIENLIDEITVNIPYEPKQ